ncbi:MAG: gliding motility-associated C-terminal domain-containing protein [Bacteroidota bacterium]
MLFCCEAKTQTEYITNGSFEQIDSCYGQPAGIGFDVFGWSGCKGWSNPIASSSDLWCENPKVGNVTPPNVIAGYQIPRTGNNMSAILINGGIIQNYREYLQNSLAYPLQNGKQYKLTFFISYNNVDCNSTQFGVKFYNQKLNDLSRLWLTDVSPNAINDITKVVSDSISWQLITIRFTANGSEKYAVIGNFEDSTKLSYTLPCDTSFWGNLHMAGGYYFIDDVSMIEVETSSPIIPNIFSPNNDLINDVWKCDLTGSEVVTCNIYNRWGNIIFQTDNPIIEWTGRTTSGINCEDGIYFYCIETEKEKYKGHIQLVR